MCAAVNDTSQVQPCLFIGLGATGIHCLELIGKNLPGDVNEGAHMLGIRMAGSYVTSHPGPAEFKQANILEMRWDEAQALRLAKQTPGYEWWLNAWHQVIKNGEDRGRLEGRMAFHLMKYFYQDSRVETYLMNLTQSLGTHARKPLMLFVITSLSEPEAACLGELMLEVLRVIGPDVVPVHIPCCLVDYQNSTGSGNSEWIIPSLRELERFMQKGQVLGGDFVDSLTFDELFNHILLIDNQAQLPALANLLTSLLNQRTASQFSSHFANVPQPGRLSMLVGRSYTFRIPVVDLRRVCSARLVLDELLKRHYLEDVQPWIRRFLLGDAAVGADWRFYQVLVKIQDEHVLSEADKAALKRPDIPVDILNTRLMQFLNEFPGSLVDVRLFLSSLEDQLVNAVEKVARGIPGIRQQLPRLRMVINAYEKVLEHWDQSYNKLKEFAQLYYEQSLKELSLQLLEVPFQRSFVRAIARQNFPASPEDIYYDDLKKPVQEWQTLTKNLRQGLDWEWTFSGDQKPFLRCLISGSAYVEPSSMLEPLCEHAYRLTGRVAENESVFDFLSRLSSADILTSFEKAPVLVQYDPLITSDRRTFKYITCVNNSIQHEWNLGPTVQYCEAFDNKRLVYTRFDYNIPVDGGLFYQNILKSANAKARNSYVFPHEQYAWQLERKMRAMRVYTSPLPAQLVRLMHNPSFFEIAMWCVFYGWIQQKNSDYANINWQLDLGNGTEPICLDTEKFPSLSIEDALTNLLIRFPLQDTEGLHPFSKGNLASTLVSLNQKIKEQHEHSSENIEFITTLQVNIEGWRESQKPFDQGLAMIQSYFLVRTKRHNHK